MNVDTNELSEYVEAVVRGIDKGVPKEQIWEGLEIEITVVHDKQAGGGIKIVIAEAGGKYSASEISKIRFRIRPAPHPVVYSKSD